MFRFAEPQFLYLLLLIPILLAVFVVYHIQKKKSLQKFGNPELLKVLTPNVSKVRPVVKHVIQLIAITILIVVLARPQFGTRPQEETRMGIEVIIALDISNSMLAQDVLPNRLEKAKRVLSRLIDDMVNDKVGLVVFAGEAFTQLPITADYVSAKIFLNSITPALIARQGTAIGSAIELSVRSFDPNSNASKAIILITDGENHEDNAVEAARMAHEQGIVVHVMGIGRPEGAPIPIAGTLSFWKDYDGNVVVTKLNEAMGRDIAQAGRGVYVRVDNTNTANRTIAQELDKLAKSEINTIHYASYNEQFQSFLILVLLLIIADFFVFERINKRLSRMKIFDLKEKFKK